jgi:hypothetical protein
MFKTHVLALGIAVLIKAKKQGQATGKVKGMLY